MRIVCVSDTHTMGPKVAVPDGDILLHCGDHTFRGMLPEVRDALAWLCGLPHRVKIAVAGNHDFYFDERFPDGYPFRSWVIKRDADTTVADLQDQYWQVQYLQDRAITIDGVKFYGSPWQPWYYGWAFNFEPGEEGRVQAQQTWAKIPDDTNVLITHAPPEGILDWTYPDDERAGCPELRKRIEQLPNLRLHAFGHLHESYGTQEYEAADGQRIAFVNCAINTRGYQPTNPPIVVDLENGVATVVPPERSLRAS